MAFSVLLFLLASCSWQWWNPAPTEGESNNYTLTELTDHSLHKGILLGPRSGYETWMQAFVFPRECSYHQCLPLQIYFKESKGPVHCGQQRQFKRFQHQHLPSSPSLPTGYSTLGCTDSAVCVGTLQTLSVKQSTVNAKTPPAGFFFLGRQRGSWKGGVGVWLFASDYATKAICTAIFWNRWGNKNLWGWEGCRDEMGVMGRNKTSSWDWNLKLAPLQ